MKRILTRADVEAAGSGGTLELGPDDVLTGAARDLAQRLGVKLNRGGGGLPPGPAGGAVPRVTAVEEGDKAIVTAVGRNRPFILAELTTRIAELGGNVHDISQRIVEDYFSSVLMVELSGVDRFATFKAELEALSREGDYKVVVQHERIFQAMHRV